MFGAPMLETEVFRKQVYCIEKSICVIDESFPDPPQSFRTPAKIWRPIVVQHPFNVVTFSHLVMSLFSRPQYSYFRNCIICYSENVPCTRRLKCLDIRTFMSMSI